MTSKTQKSVKFIRLREQIQQLTINSPSFLSQLASINAVLYHKVPYIFWVGFYLLENNKLIVGPYQGPLACQELEFPKGVCWHAISSGNTILVPDIQAFPGHIACDSRSQSEIVIPIYNKSNNIIGVLDVDSDKKNAFDQDDQLGLEEIASLIDI